MLNGLYVAASGMLQMEKKLDVISNNLANINTAGFKMDTPTFDQYLKKENEFPYDAIRDSRYNQTINAVSKLSEIYTDFSAGNIRQTGNKFDFALNNKDVFFAVDTPFGIRFTRAGNFTIDSDGYLVTQQGYKVLSRNVENNEGIRIPNGNVEVLSNGNITVDGAVLDTLYLVEFEDKTKLQKIGYNLFAAIDTLPVESENPKLMQGYVEESNINPVREMVNMIGTHRAFETYQRVIRTIDTLNERAANELGKIG
jgi:flagellar basal-body rod protein FlgG